MVYLNLSRSFEHGISYFSLGTYHILVKSLPIPLKVDLLKFTLCLYEIPQKNSSLATYEKENGVWDNKQFCCYLELVKYTEGEERQSYEKIAKHFFKNLKLILCVPAFEFETLGKTRIP